MKCRWFLMVLALPAVATDIPGSRDESQFDRFSRSSIVLDQPPGDQASYDFILGPVDKIKRDVSFEKSVRISGVLSSATYLMPGATKRLKVVEHYEQQIEKNNAKILFSCDGPDCGRATIWSSDIFRIRELSAPIRNQYYVAVSVQDGDTQSALSIYIVERGNTRVYAHIQTIVLSEDDSIPFNPNTDIASDLARRGFVVLEGITPKHDGSIRESELAMIDSLVESLVIFANTQLYVVCHISGSQPTSELMSASEECASTISERIRGSGQIQAKPFGVGPLAPANGMTATRVELVVPIYTKAR